MAEQKFTVKKEFSSTFKTGRVARSKTTLN